MSASGDEATKKEKTSGLAFLPVIFYTPETQWALGFGKGTSAVYFTAGEAF